MLPSIRERNLNFVNLSDAEKRVAVAEDVIAQLIAKKLVATSGVYAERTVGEACSVCAVGAAAVSVMNGGALNIGNYRMRNVLVENGFTHEMLREMEAFFEGGYSGWGAKYGYEHPAADNDGTYDSTLRKCFQHIIDNKGEWNAEAMGGTLIE